MPLSVDEQVERFGVQNATGERVGPTDVRDAGRFERQVAQPPLAIALPHFDDVSPAEREAIAELCHEGTSEWREAMGGKVDQIDSAEGIGGSQPEHPEDSAREVATRCGRRHP